VRPGRGGDWGRGRGGEKHQKLHKVKFYINNERKKIKPNVVVFWGEGMVVNRFNEMILTDF
jgi:hypothetical protein